MLSTDSCFDFFLQMFQKVCYLGKSRHYSLNHLISRNALQDSILIGSWNLNWIILLSWLKLFSVTQRIQLFFSPAAILISFPYWIARQSCMFFALSFLFLISNLIWFCSENMTSLGVSKLMWSPWALEWFLNFKSIVKKIIVKQRICGGDCVVGCQT